MPGTGPPVIVLGVRRSGTTLLRVMLDRNPELAVPDESYFVPQLARRHRTPVDPAAFVDDLRRLPTLVEWGRLARIGGGAPRPGMTTGEAIAAVFAAYAAERGKARWGDKTPLYMQHLDVLERLFPDARYIHLIRDGRDAALSFLSVPDGLMTEGWGHPRDAAGFACQWGTEVVAARELSARGSAKGATASSATRRSSPTPRTSCARSARSRRSSSTLRCSTTSVRRTRPARPTSSG